jgi:tetratricopeptide (TPR) repeat protein
MKEQKVNRKNNLFKENNYLYLIVLIAVLSRIIFYLFEKNNPLFLYPVLDENEYLNKVGKTMAENGMTYPFHYYHPPLYSWFVGFVLWLKGSTIWIYVVQNILGVAGTALLYKSLRKVHVNAALITSLIWAIYPIELFIESRFLAESLFVFLTLVFLPLVLSDKKNIYHYLILGLISSLLIILKTQFILFVFLYPLSQFVRKKANLKEIVVYVLISLIIPFVVSIKNKSKTGEFIFVSSNGPVNLYLGNSKNIKETLNIRPSEWRESYFPSLYDEAGIRFYEKDSIKKGQTFEYMLSGYLQSKTFDENLDIFTPAKNILHKSFIALHAAETPRNYDIYEVKAFNQYLNFTVSKNIFFPLILFMASAILFIISRFKTIRNNDKMWLLFLILLVNILPSILIFNAFRYRLPAVPFIIFFSVLFYINFMRNIKFQAFNLGLSLVLGTSILSGLLIQKIPKTETYKTIADAYAEKGMNFKAEKYYSLASEIMEKEEVSIAEKKDVYQERAKIKQEQGDTTGAIEELTKAIQTDTLSAGTVLYNRGLTNYNSGNFKAAITDFTKAINTINANNTALASCYYLRGLSFFRTNKPKKAYDDLTTSIELDKKGEVITARGILLAQLGRPRLAIQDFNFSVVVDESNFNTYFNRAWHTLK